MGKEMNHKGVIRYCRDKKEAQILADFLYNELWRHIEDAENIMNDIGLLKIKWKVSPRQIRRFVKI